MSRNEKTTVSGSSVGADVKQPLCNNNYSKSIADIPTHGNLQAINCPEKAGQEELETISMAELYDTVYPPKIPVIENLLYNGMYFLLVHPR